MFILYADKNQLTVRKREPVTSGSVNVYRARFEFSPDWDGMKCVAVFQAGSESRSVLLTETNTCEIPWEVLVKPNVLLQVGVYGTRGEMEVLPTVWADLRAILPGVTVGHDARPPLPDLWQQELDAKGDRLDYTKSGELGLYSGGKLLNSVPIEGGGGSEYIPAGPPGNGADLEFDATLTEADGVFGVTTPVQGVFSQEEFDALPEERRNKGMYVVSDSAGSEGSSGGSSMNSYDDEERVIGTWFGNPLYRLCFSTTVTATGRTTLWPMPQNATIISIVGACADSSGNQNQIPFSYSGLFAFLMYNDSGEIRLDTNVSGFVNQKIYVVVEYTKATDQE